LVPSAFLRLDCFALFALNVFGEYEIACLNLFAKEVGRSGIWILWGDIGDEGVIIPLTGDSCVRLLVSIEARLLERGVGPPWLPERGVGPPLDCAGDGANSRFEIELRVTRPRVFASPRTDFFSGLATFTLALLSWLNGPERGREDRLERLLRLPRHTRLTSSSFSFPESPSDLSLAWSQASSSLKCERTGGPSMEARSPKEGTSGESSGMVGESQLSRAGSLTRSMAVQSGSVVGQTTLSASLFVLYLNRNMFVDWSESLVSFSLGPSVLS